MESTTNMQFPNGTEISYLPVSHEAWDMESILLEYESYFKYGINVKEGDLVFDIGANIGIFSLAIFDRCKGNVQVYSFEPIPEIFNMLQHNIKPYSPNKLKIYPIGLSDKSTKISFVYYPNAPCLSTYNTEHINKDLEDIMKGDLKQVPNFLKASNDNEESCDISRFSRLSKILQLKTLFQEHVLTCQVKTVSEMIHEDNIDKIDLLKIDVNGSEMDVLLGIEEKDWKKIRQLVVKVPKGGKKLKDIGNKLKKHGFNDIQIEGEQADIQSISYFFVYAKDKQF